MVEVILRTLGFDSRNASIGFAVIGIFVFVLFPCLIEAVEFGNRDERFKENFGSFVSNKGVTVNDIGRHVVSCDDVLPKEKYLHYKGFSEKGGGLVEFGDSNVFFDSVNSKAVLNENSYQITKNATEDGKAEIFYIIDELAHRPLFMFSLGGIVVGLFSIFIFHYTQRLN